MKHLLDFDPEHRVLRLTLTGVFTEAEYLVVREDVKRFVQTDGPCHGLIDFRGVSKLDASADFVRMVAEKSPAFPATTIRVAVAPQPVIYGMIRMFQIIGDKTRQRFHVVKTIEEAHSLLGFPSLDFSRRVCVTVKS
jgi:hypothetical protein